MAVRMAGVVVVHRHPVELRAEVGFHLAHHIPGESAQVREAVAILRRDDEAEGMPVALAALDEGAAILPIAVRAIELAALAIAGRAVPLEVTKMRAGCAAAERDGGRSGPSPPPAAAAGWGCVRRLSLQPIRHGLAPADPRAPPLPGIPAAVTCRQ